MADWYFVPKPWERSGKLYKALGVGLFSRYILNGGSYWTKKEYARQRKAHGRGYWALQEGLGWIKSRKREEISRFIYTTKGIETAHVALSVPFLA